LQGEAPLPRHPAMRDNPVVTHLRRHDTIPSEFLVMRGPHGDHLFASSLWPRHTGCSLEAIDMTVHERNRRGAYSRYNTQGRYAEAEPRYQRALAIREKALGPEHPDVAQSLNNLASLYQTQGRYTEAEPLYQRVLASRERVLGAEHPDTLR